MYEYMVISVWLNGDCNKAINLINRFGYKGGEISNMLREFSVQKAQRCLYGISLDLSYMLAAASY